MSWKPYIQLVCSKLSRGSWTLLKLRNYVNTKTLKIVYHSLVYSHLQYCITSWGLASRRILDPLVKLQKRIVRFITKSLFLAHTQPLFHDLNLLKIKYRIYVNLDCNACTTIQSKIK